MPTDISSALPPAPPQDIPFPKDGATLAVWDEFIAACGGEAALRDLTTAEVCERFIKPITEGLSRSICYSSSMKAICMICECSGSNFLLRVPARTPRSP